MNYIRVTMPICKRKKKIERQYNNSVKVGIVTDTEGEKDGKLNLRSSPSLDGAMALSSHSRLVEVREVKECNDRLSELGNLSSKSNRF